MYYRLLSLLSDKLPIIDNCDSHGKEENESLWMLLLIFINISIRSIHSKANVRYTETDDMHCYLSR